MATDPAQLTKMIVDIATGEKSDMQPDIDSAQSAAAQLERIGGLKGGTPASRRSSPRNKDQQSPVKPPQRVGGKMTAEIAVLNKRGIALAADSAVTTGFRDREKIFTTANKIFTLSKVHPVGIMINGHVEHFGCPWEVIIKDFRTHLGSTAFGDLRNYVDRFSDAIKDKKFLTDDGQSVSVIISALSTIAEVESRIRDERAKWNAKTVRNMLEKMLTDANNQDPIMGFEDIKQRTFDAKYGSLLDDVMSDEQYAEDKTIPKACKGIFKAVTLSVMTHQMSSQFSTGIVIAGFGQDDMYPKLYEIAVDGGFLDKVRCYDVDSYDVSQLDEGADRDICSR